MTRRFFLSLFAALAAMPAAAFTGARSFKSRWFAKPQKIRGDWATNGHFGEMLFAPHHLEFTRRNHNPTEHWLGIGDRWYRIDQDGNAIFDHETP